ncbi:MAG: hypothetical protein CTY22_00520 [Methylomonas sp.]|nr:MAG: hypothetical protein CTY23_01640 [Methylomonas sp.]PPD27920.1 MAG: hypothetical protein CTY22_00520 [Methylomonas sp.]PPD40030.1 MAG: hypothetical protein CTY21_00520 [Methylomonas sp.]PPD41582.1 MAG: hypothetical protein CTY17_03630 [Methylomonas sp.]PPD51975.1 MAG: hypothetical protein CTY11_10165 [Methylomonas sp.]
MSENVEQKQEKDHFVLYLSLIVVALVGVILAVKSAESEKFAPIRAEIGEEMAQMNIRVIAERGD